MMGRSRPGKTLPRDENALMTAQASPDSETITSAFFVARARISAAVSTRSLGADGSAVGAAGMPGSGPVGAVGVASGDAVATCVGSSGGGVARSLRATRLSRAGEGARPRLGKIESIEKPSGRARRRAATPASRARAAATNKNGAGVGRRNAAADASSKMPASVSRTLAAGQLGDAREQRRSLPVGRSSSPAVSTAPVVPTASPLVLVARRRDVRARPRERDRRRVGARAGRLERHLAREAVRARHVHGEPAERLRAPVVAENIGADVSSPSDVLAARRTRGSSALARDVARRPAR